MSAYREFCPPTKKRLQVMNQHFIINQQVTLKCQGKVHDNSQISVDGSSCHHVVLSRILQEANVTFPKSFKCMLCAFLIEAL